MKLARLVRPSAALAALLLALALAAPLAAQNNGQTTTFTITQPDPATTATTPYRTSNSFINIEFTHNGATGSYFINTEGADIEGSTFQGPPTASSGSVAAGFNADGPKTVALVLFQTKLNITFRTQQSARITYDKTAPTWQINTVTLDGAGGTGGTALPPQAYAAGTTYYTNTGQLSLQGTIQDPNGGSTPDTCTFSVTGLQPPIAGQNWGATDGTFTGEITLDGADGAYDLDVTASDDFSGSGDDTTSRPNVSAPLRVKVVKDSAPPTIERVEVIRAFGSADTQEVLPTGTRTFIGRETVTIRVTMSERMGAEPRVTITQAGGSAIQGAILSQSTVNDRIFHYQYSVVAAPGQNGPAAIAITGAYDGPTGQPDFGYDLARNPVADNDPLGTIANGFVVDTIAPDLIKYADQQAGNVVSIPREGARISRENFPDTIQVFVEDYDNAGATQYASGVDFSRVALGSASQGGTGTTTGGVTITLLAPNGQPVSGTPSIAPPNGIFLTLPDWRNPSTGLNGFTDADGDGTAEPMEGTWTIRVGLTDKVGNTSTRTILFTVDNTPISASDLVVTLTPPANTGNPLALTGACIGNRVLEGGAFPVIGVSSTDATFSSTRSNVEFFSLVGGRNSQPQKFEGSIARTAGTTITLSALHRPSPLTVGNDDWPVPNAPVPAAYVPFGYMDPRVGQQDGLYLIRVTPLDNAGNSGVRVGATRKAYQDWEVTIDTMDPYVAWTFPAANMCTNEPLRFVDAVVVDPAAPNGNPGCGIDVAQTEMILYLEKAYREADYDMSYLQQQATPPAPGSPGRLRGLLRFVHNPNSTDPTIPSFDPDDDTYRVLLEIVDRNQIVRGLKEDGSMDGIYSIGVDPADKAGNSLDIDLSQAQGGAAPDRGTYYGLKSSSLTTQDLTKFTFLYDTIEPALSLTNFPDGSYLGGTTFTINGTTQDLSAQRDDATAPTKGGAGILKVEYKLEVVDRDGLPLTSVAARVITTGGNTNQGLFLPAQNNPIIPWTNTRLDPIRKAGPPYTDSGSNDPTRTTSFPMTAGFAGSQRELRGWRIDGSLPATEALLKPRQSRKVPPDTDPDTTQQDYYRLTVRSWDRAGNFTDVVRRVTVSLSHLTPPILQQPACGSYTNKLGVTFRWTAVAGATRYAFRLTYPNGNVLNRSVTGQELLLNLTTEGEYRWQVATVDAAGNQGAYSELCSLVLDRTPPAVKQLVVTPKSLPPQQNGRIYLGEFNVDVSFSEPLLLAKQVSVGFDPLGGIGAPAQAVTTQTFTNTASDSNWVGLGRIPPAAKPAEWDGQVTITVSGATDRAGNPMQLYYNANFEIDTGPFFESKFFASVLNAEEFTVVLVASENLATVPTVSNMVGVGWQGQRQELSLMLGSQRTYFATMKLTNSATRAISFDLTATDLDQNSSRRAVSFEVVRPTKSSTSSLVAAAGLTLTFPANAVTREGPVYLFPAATGAEATAAAAALGASASPGEGASGELLDLCALPDVQAPALGFTGPVEVSATAPTSGPVPAGSPQIGLYGWWDGAWHFLGNRRQGGRITASVSRLCPLKQAADLVGPRIELVSHASGALLDTSRPLLQATLTDGGAGVDQASIKVTVDGKTVPHEYDATTNVVTWQPARSLTEGEHAVSISAADLSGNQGQTASASLLAPAGFDFQKPVLAYPNPARISARVGYDLNQTPTLVRLRIYDMAGKVVWTDRNTSAAPADYIEWPLVDGRGRAVAPGVYAFRLTAESPGGSTAHTGKIAVLR